MTAIKNWSTTAASNNAASPDGAKEGWAPSEVNAVIRELMAQVRAFYANIEWRETGDGTGTNDCHTVTWASSTTFTTAAGDGDTTAIYHAGRRIRAEGTSTTTIYGVIASSSDNGTITTVVCTWDSGTFANETVTIALGPGVTGNPIGLADLSLTGDLTVTGAIIGSGDIRLGDNDKIEMGALTGGDLQFYHNGTNSIIANSAASGALLVSTDDTRIIGALGEDLLRAVGLGALTLYHNGNAKLATTATGVSVTGDVVATGDVQIGDGDQLELGAAVGGDMQISHSGSSATINVDTGGLTTTASNFTTKSTNLSLRDSANQSMIYATEGAAAVLAFNGTDRLATTGQGIAVNGGPQWVSGTGSPESAVSAPVGSLFSRTDGSTSTTLYVKETGAGNTGWVAK